VLSIALLLPLLAAASLQEPLEGALGFDFDAAVPQTSVAAALGATTALPPLPDNIETTADEFDSDGLTGWHYLVPQQLPGKLDRTDARVLALLTADHLPARLIVQMPVTGCGDLYGWVNESLQRKYGVTGEPDTPARAPHLKASRYTQGNRQVDVFCGPDLLLQYTDLSALNLWRQEQQQRVQLRLQQAAGREAAAQEIAHARAQAFAEQFTLGDRSRLQGGFGVVFNQRFVGAQAVEPDTPTSVELDDLPAPFDQASFEIELDPAGHPIELTGELEDPLQEHFAAVVAALEAKFGAPIKDSDRHKIFRINGNFFVVRALARSGITRVNLLDGQARRAQRDREKAREAAELAAMEARFHEETKGL
jgi:hypothetical protein